jgi:hypothetical protein
VFHSLLTPPDAEPNRIVLPPDTIRDLGLEELAHAIGRAGTGPSAVLQLLTHLPQDPGEISYRQSVLRSFWEDRHLCEQMRSIVQSMRELTHVGRTESETDRPLLASIWRLGELELYVELLEDLSTLLNEHPRNSEGLQLLAAEVATRRADPAYQELRKELPALRDGLKLHQSVTVGINLDDKLRPVEAALLSLNAQKYRQGQFLSGFFKRAAGDEFLTQTPLHRNYEGDPFDLTGKPRMPLSPLFEELDSVLKTMLKPLARELRKYIGVNTSLMRALVPEIGFYLGAVDYFRFLEQAGYPICFPEISSPARRRSSFDALYNVRLASRWAESRGANRMVGNSLRMDDEARLYVLTGPNGGGKTTFTQAVGMASVLGQVGLAVPAERAEISPLDGIYTHFQTEENYEDEIGRFEDEARRLSAIFDAVAERSLVLLNEPLSSTSPDEAEAINQSLLEALRIAGARGLVTTHFHGLARACPSINESIDGESHLATLSAGTRTEHGRTERTFRIEAADPDGRSYAHEISLRYGLDSDSLRSRLSTRRDEDEAGAS